MSKKVLISIRLPEELARRLKSAAALNGESMQDVLTRKVDEYLAEDCTQARELAAAVSEARG